MLIGLWLHTLAGISITTSRGRSPLLADCVQQSEVPPEVDESLHPHPLDERPFEGDTFNRPGLAENSVTTVIRQGDSMVM